LEVGKVGIVGFVAGSGTSRVAHDVGSDAVFFNNPDLPQTRSELALPLNARGRIIGVLDVQSTKPAVFTEGDVTTLQILADQIALAIDNTRLMAEANQALQELRNLYAIQVGEAWRKRLGDRKIAYIYGRQSSQTITDTDSLQHGLQADPATLSVPIVFRGHPLGSITLRKESEQSGWTHEEIQVVHTIVTQFSLALENARLLEETQRRAERERRISEITARIRSSNDPQVILQTAATELRNALKVTHSQIVINPAPDSAGTASKGNGHKTPTAASTAGEDSKFKQGPPVAQEIK
jgi:GAF domain-containing protein